jgi:hypothetical protein
LERLCAHVGLRRFQVRKRSRFRGSP